VLHFPSRGILAALENVAHMNDIGIPSFASESKVEKNETELHRAQSFSRSQYFLIIIIIILPWSWATC
jgi:hypothetical protein